MMKLNQLVLLGATFSLVSALSFSDSITRVLANPSAGANNPTAAPTQSNTTPVTGSQPVALMNGAFVAAEKPTTGKVQITTENGQRYLLLDSAFSTSNQGPDLHVVLDPSSKPPMSYQNHSGYVNLGKLQKFSGTQRYPIPAAIDLADFESVGVWCRMANATFGYAPLRPASTASAQ
ncbi:FIG00562345: hypothetical protein [uncultured Synechococcales cyanobacterium]|uniref:DM13 domain-containing protein n=1 Tax=uncultured Synechococcales cyanobacterium TaxID=1936017 RepID=A0A6J4VUQ5_9CYAN|nr:FIG00562345: hypothetical protein [uncultured Synechococcales cyanobacterium]